MVENFAPASRRVIWDKLSITPGGPTYEILDSVTRYMTNIDSDYRRLHLKLVKNYRSIFR